MHNRHADAWVSGAWDPVRFGDSVQAPRPGPLMAGNEGGLIADEQLGPDAALSSPDPKKIEKIGVSP